MWLKATPSVQFSLASCLSCRDMLYLGPFFWKFKLNHTVSARAVRSLHTVTGSSLASLLYGNSLRLRNTIGA